MTGFKVGERITTRRSAPEGQYSTLYSNRHYSWLRLCQRWCLISFEWCMLVLGPILIATVIVLVGCETFWTLRYIVPIFAQYYSMRWCAHVMWIAFLAFNGLFNYFACVLTDPGTHTSDLYRRLVFEACEKNHISVLDLDEYCEMNGFNRPRIEEGGGPSRRRQTHIEQPRHRRPGSSWLDRGPFDWGYCKHSLAPKAPRSHYDHVTKKLVLNMDHYCPWMFNVVGYANYRYFVLFLFWVASACVYGVVITFQPFLALTWPAPHRKRWRPINKRARSPVMFTFVLAVSVGIAVFVLFGWHVFLVLTGQTTIEFYGNATLRSRARSRGYNFSNPYDRGFRGNWQHVFGRGHPLIAILPSFRPPPAKPWPSPKYLTRSQSTTTHIV